MPRARSGPTLGPRGGGRLSRTVWLVCVCVWCSDMGLPLIAPDCHASWQSVVQRHGSAVDARLDYGLTGPGPHSPFTHPSLTLHSPCVGSSWPGPARPAGSVGCGCGTWELSVGCGCGERGSCVSAVAVGNVGAVCRLWLWNVGAVCRVRRAACAVRSVVWADEQCNPN
jgi:hypothetical protein